MKRIFLLSIICMGIGNIYLQAQQYIDKEGTIEIFSKTPIFTIEGLNKKVASILNFETGKVAASTLVRSFKFHEALVEDHFNENYMESEKFPKATFDGMVTNIKDVDLKKNGEYKIIIKGNLMIHGVTKSVETSGIIIIKDGKITGKTHFNVSLAAYKIRVEESYKDAIKDEIKLDIKFEYVPKI